MVSLPSNIVPSKSSPVKVNVTSMNLVDSGKSIASKMYVTTAALSKKTIIPARA